MNTKMPGASAVFLPRKGEGPAMRGLPRTGLTVPLRLRGPTVGAETADRAERRRDSHAARVALDARGAGPAQARPGAGRARAGGATPRAARARATGAGAARCRRGAGYAGGAATRGAARGRLPGRAAA